RGWTVRALDGDALSIDALRSEAARRGLAVQADVVDLEAGAADLGREAYDLIVVVHYLHRPLFPALLRALAPGGLLVYETLTVDQAKRGRPREPDFLLEPGELPRRVAPLEVLRAREGEFEGRMVAAVAARKAAILRAKETHHETKRGTPTPRKGLHPHRAAGGDRDHRDPDRVAPSRRPEGAGSGRPDA